MSKSITQDEYEKDTFSSSTIEIDESFPSWGYVNWLERKVEKLTSDNSDKLKVDNKQLREALEWYADNMSIIRKLETVAKEQSKH